MAEVAPIISSTFTNHFTLGFMFIYVLSAIAVLGMVVAYVLASGAAFVATYRYPDAAPVQLFGAVFRPLDWLAQRVPAFARVYAGFHQWCYRTYVAGPHET